MPGFGGLFNYIKIDDSNLFVHNEEIGAVDGGFLVWPMAAVSQALRDCNKGASVSAYFSFIHETLKNSRNDRFLEVMATSQEFLKVMRAAMPRNWRNATPHSWTRLPEIF